MSKPDGGQAFPVPETEFNHFHEGMTLRDYFAAKAMASACLVNQGDMPKAACQQAYVWADAMLEARNN